jgi:hypothetical protein
MADTSFAVTAGAGTNLHTFTRSIGGQTVHDEVVVLGEPYLASYVFNTGLTSVATSNSHLLQIMAGASLKVQIRSIRISQSTLATTVTLARIALYRLTTAGTGGVVQTAGLLDNSDAAIGATGMVLPTVKGTEAGLIWLQTAIFAQTLSTAGGNGVIWEWNQDKYAKPLIIPAGAANGIAIKQLSGVAAATVEIDVTLTEANF